MSPSLYKQEPRVLDSFALGNTCERHYDLPHFPHKPFNGLASPIGRIPNVEFYFLDDYGRHHFDAFLHGFVAGTL